MSNAEVKIFNNDQLTNLLIGKQPRIGHGISEKRSQSTLNRDFTDFSKFKFPEPIEPIKKNPVQEEEKTDRASTQQAATSQFNKLRQEEKLIGQVDQYLSVYESNHKRKTLMMHQEFEEHYLQPVSRKLMKKVNGPEYDKYVRARSQAIKTFETQISQKDSLQRQLPSIPTISFDTSDIVDPVMKYRKNAQKEQTLTKIIAMQNGEYKPPEPIQERDTMNLKKWKILAQTRFYEGTGSTPKGKKVFPQKFLDNVREDDFAEPLPIIPGKRKGYVPKDNDIF
ncbi:hypothetical protein TVAG_000410 [Trichomonas vaginalis G3]|uniref:Uncharacterized protein n=1 Tax=Trichomonas vaginalis (strain ATCC PRA-98 / G3) TaxID=412133 RepID=A2EHR7_TRIV3|nr:hypothetical protein TVAGG3_0077280 [Trichomonas vaginalis G3]EAY07757.1 hypothetical protein TVAG_000410 [Trichomonas vaginalis G3]KAI5542973.1 hypothetical protein TVAGG3_0077280 [Trichomonas vaginalis G3]|eukprot:XP_001319980.1 hypothetical protein [Trichomonas vaginalis G3]